MKLKIIYSKKNLVVRLINVDAVASEKSSNRALDTWTQNKGTNLRVTYWINDIISPLNTYKYNRVNVHYTNNKNNTVTQSYYCIEEIIQMKEMTFDNFDDNIIV